LLGPRSLQALTEDLRSFAPDHIAVTGDLVNLGLDAEIAAAGDWLAALGEEGDVSVVPGNHDAYLPDAISEFNRVWRPFMQGDRTEGPTEGFPFVRRRGPIALIGVSSAVATAPLMAIGRIRREQADALGEELDGLGREGAFRVVLIHHPPIPRSTPWHRRLIGADHFRHAVKTAGAELILHGHNHHTSIAGIAGPSSAVPVVGATSASLHPHRGRPGGSYILYRIGKPNGVFACEMIERGARTPGGPVETLAEHRLHG
jgi:3',5'-cyclic AMP phosphodiesterase CpdA